MVKVQKNELYYAGLLISAWLLGLAGEAIYAPAMPAIANSFGVSETLIKLTITYFIFGKTVSMFICSPIAEAFGRRQFVLFGLTLFILGGILCAATKTINIMLAGRLIQGLGCSVTILMGRAIVNDCFEGGKAARVFSFIFSGNAVGIFIIPTLGGYMSAYLNWRWIFLILSFYGSLIFILMWRFLPQTNPKMSFGSLQPKTILNNYKTIVRSPALWGFLLCVAFMMEEKKHIPPAPLFSLIKTVGLSSVQYGYLTSVIWAAHLSGTFLAGWIGVRWGIDQVMTIGVGLISIASLVLIMMSVFHLPIILLFIAAMLLYMFGTGFVIVSAAVGIVRPFPNLIGFATAFAMALEFGISSLVSYLISYHSSSMFTIANMVVIMGILTFLSLVLLNYYKKCTPS